MAPRTDIVEATTRYESWLAARLPLIKQDLALKHRAMSAGIFPFLRGTFYRWAEEWASIVGDVAEAPQVLAAGDLHVENFGTWRDAEGRLIWGVNDFDEAWPLPYTNDLVRLATSALIAIDYHDLSLEPKHAVAAILDGYREALEAGGHAFVLAEYHPELRDMALGRLRDPQRFWEKLDTLPTVRTLPPGVAAMLERALPERHLTGRIVHRVAGVGSLGRQRFVLLAQWRGENRPRGQGAGSVRLRAGASRIDRERCHRGHAAARDLGAFRHAAEDSLQGYSATRRPLPRPVCQRQRRLADSATRSRLHSHPLE